MVVQASPVENPVHALARAEGLRTVRVPGSCDGNMSGYGAVYTASGDRDGDPGAAIRKRANAALDCLNTSAASAKVEQRVLKVLLGGATACSPGCLRRKV